MRLAGLALLLITSGCSTLVPGYGARLVCERSKDPCPTDADLQVEVAAFAAWVPGFDTGEDLTVHIYDHDQRWTLEGGAQPVVAIGFSENEHTIYATSLDVVTHELMHVQFWRVLGDPDVNHAAPPGPWGDFTDRSIAALNARLAWGGL